MVEYGGGLVERILQIGFQIQWSVLISSIFIILKKQYIWFCKQNLFALELDGAGLDETKYMTQSKCQQYEAETILWVVTV